MSMQARLSSLGGNAPRADDIENATKSDCSTSSFTDPVTTPTVVPYFAWPVVSLQRHQCNVKENKPGGTFTVGWFHSWALRRWLTSLGPISIIFPFLLVVMRPCHSLICSSGSSRLCNLTHTSTMKLHAPVHVHCSRASKCYSVIQR